MEIRSGVRMGKNYTLLTESGLATLIFISLVYAGVVLVVERRTENISVDQLPARLLNTLLQVLVRHVVLRKTKACCTTQKKAMLYYAKQSHVVLRKTKPCCIT